MALIKHLKLCNFRNFARREVSFFPGMNAIIGPNAIGKTTILEAISLLSTGRSFRTTKLHELIRQGEREFSIEAIFQKDGVEQSLSLSFDGEHKKLQHNSTSYSSFSHLLGLLTTVTYAPSDIQLIHGMPEIRRRFLNIFIAQADPLYIYYLMRYSKALGHRNALIRKGETATLDVWEEELYRSSSFLMQRRNQAIEQLSSLANRHYQTISEGKDESALAYLPSITKELKPSLWKEIRSKDIILKCTSIGPHRDDMTVLLRQLSAKSFASEGQKRSMIAAIKLAECELLDSPILLIDDAAVHLDDARKAGFFKQIEEKEQVFLTSPHSSDVPKNSHALFL